MKNSKKIFNLLILKLIVLSGLIFINCENKNETKKSVKKISAVEIKAKMHEERKKWEASPDGIMFKKWKNSSEGKKVRTSYTKIKKEIGSFKEMEAVVTSVTFQRENTKALSPKWLIVKINEDKYMMQFSPKEFEQLKALGVNDKIIIKSRSAGYSPNHPYLILSSDYISKNNKILFKRDVKNKGC